MNEPTTSRDERFSYPDAPATSWADTRRLLEAADVFWISTVRADGRPHVSPVTAVLADDALHFTTATKAQKAANLRTNPRVCLTTGSNEWQRGPDVVVEGEAVQVTDTATLCQLAHAWASRWDGRWQYGVREDAPLFKYRYGNGAGLVFRVEPAKVLVFGRPEFGQIRHVF